MPDLPSVRARSLDFIASAVGNRLHQVSWGSGELPKPILAQSLLFAMVPPASSALAVISVSPGGFSESH